MKNPRTLGWRPSRSALPCAARPPNRARPCYRRRRRSVSRQHRRRRRTCTTGAHAQSGPDTGLQHNLGLLQQEQAARSAHGARWSALADLLPDVSATIGGRRQVINLEAFGFPVDPPIVGPFNVFDARVFLSQPLVDLEALNTARRRRRQRAEVHGVRTARELVVLVTVNLYLTAVTNSSRIEVARAQLETAEALLRQASDLKNAGLIAGIDVLRAQVEVQTQGSGSLSRGERFRESQAPARPRDRSPGPPGDHPRRHDSVRAAVDVTVEAALAARLLARGLPRRTRARRRGRSRTARGRRRAVALAAPRGRLRRARAARGRRARHLHRCGDGPRTNLPGRPRAGGPGDGRRDPHPTTSRNGGPHRADRARGAHRAARRRAPPPVSSTPPKPTSRLPTRNWPRRGIGSRPAWPATSR